MSAVAPEDVGLAGQGDLAALRRMRDHWLDLVIGLAANPFLPKHEALAQLELLAELAASHGRAEDQVALLAAFQVRIDALEHNRAAAEGLVKEAVEAKNAPGLDHWSALVVEYDERLGRYHAKRDELLGAIFVSSDAEASAMLVTALTLQADRGDERAAPLLQFIMDSVTPERAQAIQAEVRKMEKEAAQ